MFEKLVSAPRNLINFYGDVKTELKKVTWPSKKEVYGTTIVVVATVVFFGFYLFLVDIVLKQAIEWVFATFR
jgi:preprotein translocase subunit SecE